MVTLYSKPACPQCTMTERLLAQLEIPFEKVDVTLDESALKTVTDLGYMQAPVVMVGEEHWSGFQPDRVKAIAL